MQLAAQTQSKYGVSKDGQVTCTSSIAFEKETRTMTMTVDYTRSGGYLKSGPEVTTATSAAVLPEHNRGAYHQNFPHTVTGDWKLTVVDSKGSVLGTGELEATRKTSTHISSSYDGRGGILPLGSIPRGTVSRTQYTVFDVKSFAPC